MRERQVGGLGAKGAEHGGGDGRRRGNDRSLRHALGPDVVRDGVPRGDHALRSG